MITTPSTIRWVPALLFLMVLNGFVLFSWAKKDTRPLAWDQATHTKIAFEYRDRIAAGPLSDLFRPVDWNYPPLYHLALIPVLNFLPDVADAGVVVNYFYLCFLILTVFLIGQKLMGDWPGFTAASMVMCYPILVGLSHNTLIDLSLVAWVSAGFFCLLSSEDFSKRAWSMAFGLCLGLGMLTKWTALAYLLFPLMVSFWKAFRSKNILNVFLALLVCGVVMSPWYIKNFVPMMIRIPQISGFSPASGTNLSGLPNLFWYPLSFGEQLGFGFFLLLIPGLLVVFWRPKLAPVFLWFVGSLILFSLIRNRNTRYFAPALPAVALLSVAWLPSFRRIPYILVLIFTGWFFWGSVVHADVHKSVRFLWQTAWVLNGEVPLQQDWRHGEITRKIQEVHGIGTKPASVLVVSNHPYLFSQSLYMSMRAMGSTDVSFHGVPKRRPFEFRDFILFKTGDLGPATSLSSTNPCADVIRKPAAWFTKSFKEVGRWPLPDDSEAILYHFQPTPESNGEEGLFNLSLKELVLPNILATGVEVTVKPISKAESRLGHFKELIIRAEKLQYKTIEFCQVKVRLVDPQINLPYFFETQEIQLARLGALEPQATIESEVLLSLAAKKVKWLKDPQVHFDGPNIRISGRAYGVPISVGAELLVKNKTLSSKLLTLKVAGIPIPRIFLKNLSDKTIPLSRGDDWAYDIDIKTIQGTGTALKLGAQ